ncbi:MAG: diaminopimelate decarboxylase [Polyangiaceae bacterium]|nr:diaminopimelate decarboxylase [Polyangiaceae bacterium]
MNRPLEFSLEYGGLRLSDIVADRRIGTPSYVYDVDAMANEARCLEASFGGAPHLVAYAVKANSAPPIVRALAAEGCGADVVSGGELALALRLGIAPSKIVYSGVAKQNDEIDRAIAAGPEGIGAIHVESVEEITRIGARAKEAGRVARISIRVNPAVHVEDIDTHAHIATGHDEAKFGVPLSRIANALDMIAQTPWMRLVGVSAHVGSQITSVDTYLLSARTLFQLAREIMPRFALSYVDTGGGFGIDYGDGCPPRPADFIRAALALEAKCGLRDLALYCEPGRSLVGAHGVLIARVTQRKIGDAGRRWIILDAGMNDLIRPALYQARHRIVPLRSVPGPVGMFRVVGPVCESSDDFGVHELPEGPLHEVAILDAGAYGFSMASQYNGRTLPAEVFVRGGRIEAISPRRTMDAWVDERLAMVST